MDLNYFKDVLFDLINDSFRLDIVDIISNDKESRPVGKFMADNEFQLVNSSGSSPRC